MKLSKIISETVGKVNRKVEQRWPFALIPDLEHASNYSMGSPTNVHLLYQLGTQIVSDGINGDLVECGVCNGGSAAAIAIGIGKSNWERRQLHLFDSFEGLPEPDPIDGEQAFQHIGDCLGSIDKVREVFSKINFPDQQLHLYEGWFEDTFPTAPIPEKIAFLHIDADWFSSVNLALETFYDRVVDGGIILLDDFGYWEGCREAFYEFCEKRSIRPLLERAEINQAYWIKGKLHNRLS